MRPSARGAIPQASNLGHVEVHKHTHGWVFIIHVAPPRLLSGLLKEVVS